jgi:pyruvate/2-oxoglutarate dehydrogenase complex dihydrolipoamide acyltransferase (E2) component
VRCASTSTTPSTPALHDADRLTVPDLMAGLKDLVARARAGRLRGSETADPTITVTSLGDVETLSDRTGCPVAEDDTRL